MRHAAIVRAIRRQAGWSREEMATNIGATAKHIKLVEAGKERLSREEVNRLADALGSSLPRLNDSQTPVP